MTKKTIPMGAVLVMMIGPSGAGKSTFAAKHFSKHEVISTDVIREELAGDWRRQDMNDVVFDEFYRRIQVRLQFGLRAVADATHLKDADRKRTARIAMDMGLPVVYVVVNRSVEAKMASAGWRETVRVKDKSLIESHEETFQANRQKILAGDGMATTLVVVDPREDFKGVVRALPRSSISSNPWDAGVATILGLGYDGVTAVGDIHGNLEGMRQAVEHARSKKHFLIFMGDIVDYGRHTLDTALEAARIVSHGEGMSILGNHEKKILRIIQKERTEEGFIGNLSPGNEVTLNQLKAMLPSERLSWENIFTGLVTGMPHHLVLGDHLFVHGAGTPKMFEDTIFRFHSNSREEAFAMYGETTGEFIDGYPVRVYDWVDEIPARKTVVVGHAKRDDTPFVQKGALGGTAVFLDTGSSKEGHLSWMDLTIGKYFDSKTEGYRLVDPIFHAEK